MIATEARIYSKCLSLNIEVEDYFYLCLLTDPLLHKEEIDKWNSKSYIKEILNRLEEKGYVNQFDVVELTDKAKELFSAEYADEFWNAYPTLFPLQGGANFVAKSGDRAAILELYVSKVSPEKHLHVMNQLKKYIRYVQTRKINGNKIGDWVAREMWDLVEEMEKNLESEPFKEDI